MFFNLALTFYLQANLLLFPTVSSYMGLQIPCVFRWSDGRKKAGKPAVQSGNILFYLQIPGYICCHPRVVRLHLPSGHGSGDVVRFEIDKAYIPKNQKAYVHEEYVGILQNFIWEFNQNVAYVNSGENVSGKFSSFFNINTPVASYKLMKLTDIEIDDIASLSLHYSYEIVINALSVVYKEYYMYEKTVNNLAGLLSTIIRSQFNNLKKAA